MKKLVVTLMFTVVGGNAILAQTNFYTNVTNLWFQGYKSNVLEIANTRLVANSNDIAGLILKAEYHLEFCEDRMLSNAYLRVVQIGDTITTTNFVQRWQAISRDSILGVLDDIAKNPMTDQEIQTERPKGFIKHKPLSDGRLVEALLKDGYFD